MPELPEVETVKNTLIPLIKGKTISKVDIFFDRLIQSDINNFKKEILNKTIIDVDRYGKFIFFRLSEDYTLIIHLRMEGKFQYHNNKNDNIRISSTTLIFYFSDDTVLSFNDTRKFGLMYLAKNDEVSELKFIKKLGPEANKLNREEYGELTKKFKRNIPIKSLLLEQSNISGIGNIYADEILYLSKVNPLTKGKDISDEKYIEIFDNSKIVLEKAIKLGGSTIHSFSSNGIDGKFQNELLCYGKEGEICPRCGTIFHKIFLKGRGTTFCPNCQINHELKTSIGITGPIGSGKSEVLKYLKTKGYLVLSSDELIHELYKDPYLSYKFSKIYFKGFDINNKAHREKVKELLINNPNIKKEAEKILYKALEEKLINIITTNKDKYKNKIAVEVPLLFKAHYEYLFDKILVIEVSKDTQIKNLTKRNENIESSLKLNKDYFIDNKNKDIIAINNDNTLKDLYNQIDEIIK